MSHEKTQTNVHTMLEVRRALQQIQQQLSEMDARFLTGAADMVSNTVTISDTEVHTDAVITATFGDDPGASAGALWVDSITEHTEFVIKCRGADDKHIHWFRYNPAE